MLYSLVYICYGLDALTDWTYSVCKSWGKDREGTTEINLENNCPSTRTTQTERGAKIWGTIEKTEKAQNGDEEKGLVR